ncbi:MAG TPA: TIGR03619 family F420-dependent LLM class oxidoreductase [Acidimicrobiales bacterium]|nr:TIGR03619 family F420-dependent LLM class oxidoreductase [Acidimicrobiales bacterium]
MDSGGALVRQGVRLGVITPVATQLPDAHAGWEAEAGIDEMARIAERADRLGFDHLTCSEHVAVPPDDAAVRGGTYWDPLATLGYLAARTQRIRLATYVLVLGYHHPLAIAKRYGTLDRVSDGRLVLGVGVGTLEAEFRLLGAPFEGRGARADDALRALRAAWGRREVDHDGSWIVEPHATNAATPIWVGGRTRRSLRRAVELGDGWAPFWLGVDDVAQWLRDVDRPARFEVVGQPGAMVDPSADPDRVDELLARWAGAGATVVDLHLAHRSLAHYLEQLEALAS